MMPLTESDIVRPDGSPVVSQVNGPTPPVTLSVMENGKPSQATGYQTSSMTISHAEVMGTTFMVTTSISKYGPQSGGENSEMPIINEAERSPAEDSP